MKVKWAAFPVLPGDPPGPETVVLADDDTDNWELIGDAFRAARLECRLDCVADGVELLQRLYVGPSPKLVLLDMNMPRMDGRTALKRMRGDKTLSSIPVVVMSSSRDAEDIEAMRKLGARDYIQRPTKLRDLQALAVRLPAYWES